MALACHIFSRLRAEQNIISALKLLNSTKEKENAKNENTQVRRKTLQSQRDRQNHQT